MKKNSFQSKTAIDSAKARPVNSSSRKKNFPGILQSLASELSQTQLKESGPIEDRSAPLAHLDYKIELQMKNRGLGMFWQQYNLPGIPNPVLPSPKPRAYRTTSKRKAFYKKSKLYLSIGSDGAPEGKVTFRSSSLEPFEHAEIYRFLQEKLNDNSARIVATHLNYLIVRGGYDERIVIFNVDAMSGPIVRKLKMIAAQLQDIPGLVNAAFIYLDPSHSDYYLESKRPEVSVPFKKLFGPAKLMIKHDGCRYSYDPTSFSQVNESIVPLMLQTARQLLQPKSTEYLLDLFCGYGLFSHYLAPDYQGVLAIDAEGPAIRSAISSCKLNSGHHRPKFLAGKITAPTLGHLLQTRSDEEVLLLDPPRQGPQPGVIDVLGKRQPRKVLHIFCGVDQIPTSIREWQRNGYEIQQVVPLDMFPGSANLEVLILFGRQEN